MRRCLLIGAAMLLILPALHAQVSDDSKAQARLYAKLLTDQGISRVSCTALPAGGVSLNLYQSNITNLSLVREIPVRSLNLTQTSISDLSPLKGTQIQHLYLSGTPVTDLTPLRGLPLSELRFDPHKVTKGLEEVRHMKTLSTIGFRSKSTGEEVLLSPKEFWARLAAGDMDKPAPAPVLHRPEATSTGEVAHLSFSFVEMKDNGKVLGTSAIFTFTNRGTKTVDCLACMCSAVDANGRTIQESSYGMSKGTMALAPGQHKEESIGWKLPEQSRQARIRIYHILYSDGTEWKQE